MNFICARFVNKLYIKTCAASVSGLAPRIKINYDLGKIVILNEGTLTGRLIKYLNKDSKCVTRTTSTVELQDALSNKYGLNIEELQERAISLEDNFHTESNLVHLIATVDYESCLRTKSYNTTEMLWLLNIFIHITPNRITNCKFYKLAMKDLKDGIDSMTKDELLKYIFFVALQKKTKFANQWIERTLRLLEKDLNILTTEELCIICNSTFKTGTKITNKNILDKVKTVINDNLIILNDPALFITLIKSVRQNRYQDENTLSTISCTILFNKTFHYYSFGAICHILALYADYFYYDKELLDVLVTQCLDFLKESKNMPKESYITEQIRMKDLTRFLWILSSLNYKLEKDIFEDVISRKITEKIKDNEYDDSSADLIDCMLYLWILNFQAMDVVNYYFEQHNVNSDINQKSKHRLNLLLTCIKQENPSLYLKLKLKPSGLLTYQIEQQIAKRLSLQRVLNALKIVSPSLEINKFDFTCEIPYLNIVGITGYKKKIYKSVYIEVLDENTSLKNTENEPTGPMSLKLRLLDKTDEGIIQVEEKVIESMTEKELEDYLESEIKLVC